MKIYVVTKNDETVAVMDNEVSGALHFSDDEFHRYLDNGASTFDLTVAKKHRIYSNATDIEMEDFQYLVANNFLIFTYKNKDYKFTIRRVEETETSIRLFCEDLSFDLLNEYRGPYIADKAYNIAKYVNDCLYDSGYTIGINEFAKNTRTLKWEGDDTVLKRLLSICNSFDAELEFETQLNNDRTVNKQLVHLRKRVGLNRPDIELKYGREVSSIRRNVDLTELITAIKPRGHENDGKYVTIKNVAKEVKDADGNVAYFTKKGSEYLYAPMANQIYGSPEKKSGGYIVGQFSYDTESDTELYNRALTELQLKCMPAYEYEIEGFYDVDIGDTVRAIDEAYNPILMLEARISEQVISFTDPTRNKTVYSNYRVLNNLVSQSLLDRIDDVKDYAEQVARTYIFSLKNVGSSMFKNGIGEVTYTAKAEKNNKDVTSEFDSFNWTKQLKDGTPDEAWNALHVDFGTTLTVTPEDFEDTATFSYVALKGDETFGGASGVVTKVYDGENGKTPIKGVDYFDGEDGQDGRSAYLHIRYSQNANGTPMTDDPVGAVYVGMLVSQNPTPSTVPADYDWTLVKGADGIPGETGPDGKTSYLHIKYSDDGGKTLTANNGETAGQWLGQYVDFESTDSTDVSKYAWSKIKGEDGTDGKDGVAGKDGVGLKSTAIQYAQSTSGTIAPTTGWANSVPTLVKGQYLWTKTVWTYTDNSSETGYTVSYNAKDGNDGTDGVAGKDGVGISNTVIEYVGAVSGTSKPTSGWSTSIPTVPQGQYLWTRTTWTYTDGTTEQGYSAALMGPKGDKGDTGDDGQTPVVHPAWSWSADGTDRFTTVYPGENLFIVQEWEKLPPRPYQGYISQLQINLEPNTEYVISTNIPNWADNTTCDLFVFNSSGTPNSGINGVALNKPRKVTTLADGVVIVAMRNREFNTGAWWAKLEKGNIPTIYTPAPSEDYANAYPLYEGTYTDYSDTASQNPADYTWRRIIGESGQDGVAGADGKGIKSTAVTYQASTSGTTAPTGTWSDNVPTVPQGQYLWTRTIWTYTDNSTETGYAVAYMGTNGNDGRNGVAGKDGVGIKSTAITYAASTSGTTSPTSGWSSTVPTVAPGSFLWTKTVWTYTDNTTETGYSVGKIGEKGATGPQGSQGPQGIQGPQGPQGPKGDRGVMGVAYMQPTQPADTTEGATWFKTESTDSDKIIGVYTYKSGWQPKKYASAALAVEELSALSANLGNVTAGNITGVNINGSRFVNETDYGNTGTEIHATTTVAGNISMEWKSNVGTSNGLLTIYPDFLQSDMYSDTAKKQRVGTWSLGNGGLTVGQGNPGVSTFKGAAIGPNGIGITDPRYAPTYGEVSLSYQDLITLPQRIITDTTSDFVPYANSLGSTSTPTCDRKMRQVQLSGAFKNTVAFSGVKKMATLPVGYRPAAVVSARCQSSGSNTHYVYVNPDGSIYTDRYSAGTVQLNAWLKIDMTFIAGDL